MNHPIIRRLAASAAACTVLFGTALTFTGNAPQQTAEAADMHIEDFSLSDLTVTDAYCANAFSKEIEYLLSFDTDRLLCGFRENAKMNTYGAKRYGGWENTLIAGHTVGHYLTACAQAYQNPAMTAEQRSKLSGMLDKLLAGMQECQKNSKGKPGFLWAGQMKEQIVGKVLFRIWPFAKMGFIR